MEKLKNKLVYYLSGVREKGMYILDTPIYISISRHLVLVTKKDNLFCQKINYQRCFQKTSYINFPLNLKGAEKSGHSADQNIKRHFYC